MQLIDLMYLGVYMVIFYSSILWLTAFFHYWKQFFKRIELKKFPTISFLIPAYNEGNNIRKCIKSLLNLDYPKEKVKIFVIDDGSEDDTRKIVIGIAKKLKNVKLLKQDHRGKGAAINNGLKHVKSDLVACMDADSSPNKNYLKKIVGYFSDKEIGAITPALKITKTDTIIRKTQWLEYLFSIFLRKLFCFFQCQYVAPGPGSVYRTSILKKIGGFDETSMTEDMEIAFRLIDRGYRIENCVDAYVKTDSPENFKKLFKQRVRWYRGYIQNVKKYFHMVLNPKFGNLGMFLLPMNFVWMFTLFFLLVAPLYTLVNNSITYLINWGYINYYLFPIKIEMNILSIDFYSFFSVLFFILTGLIILFSIRSSKEKINIRKRFDFYLLFIFLYPILISLSWISSIIFEIFGVKRRW
jgi:cellulose synthase/poly-beta-1,6-N-acetylglucosamine synthase-like glycosyltransferase